MMSRWIQRGVDVWKHVTARRSRPSILFLKKRIWACSPKKLNKFLKHVGLLALSLQTNYWSCLLSHLALAKLYFCLQHLPLLPPGDPWITKKKKRSFLATSNLQRWHHHPLECDISARCREAKIITEMMPRNVWWLAGITDGHDIIPWPALLVRVARVMSLCCQASAHHEDNAMMHNRIRRNEINPKTYLWTKQLCKSVSATSARSHSLVSKLWNIDSRV